MVEVTANERGFYRLGAVLDLLGVGRSTLYASVQDGLFVRPVQLVGSRASGWPRAEVHALLDARTASLNAKQIRSLVAALHERRRLAAPKL